MQIVQVQPVFGPLPLLLVHQIARVSSGIVDHNDTWNRVRLERNLIEECDHIVACRRSLLSAPNQLTVMT